MSLEELGTKRSDDVEPLVELLENAHGDGPIQFSILMMNYMWVFQIGLMVRIPTWVWPWLRFKTGFWVRRCGAWLCSQMVWTEAVRDKASQMLGITIRLRPIWHRDFRVPSRCTRLERMPD